MSKAYESLSFDLSKEQEAALDAMAGRGAGLTGKMVDGKFTVNADKCDTAFQARNAPFAAADAAFTARNAPFKKV